MLSVVISGNEPAVADGNGEEIARALFHAVGQASKDQLEFPGAVDALRSLPGLRALLVRAEVQLLEWLKAEGFSWEEISRAVYDGAYSRQAMGLRYRSLGGEREWVSGRRPGHRW